MAGRSARMRNQLAEAPKDKGQRTVLSPERVYPPFPNPPYQDSAPRKHSQAPREHYQIPRQRSKSSFQSSEGGASVPKVTAAGYPTLPGEIQVEKSKMDTISQNSRNYIATVLTGPKFLKSVYPQKLKSDSGHDSRSTSSQSTLSSMARQPMTRAPPEAPSRPFPTLVLSAWLGDGQPVYSWNHLQNDQELWFKDADTVVYVGYDIKGIRRPRPTLRVDSTVLLASTSEVFRTLLSEGSLVKLNDRATDVGSSSSIPGRNTNSDYRKASSFFNARLGSVFVHGKEGVSYSDLDSRHTLSNNSGGISADNNGVRPGGTPPKYAIYLPPSDGHHPMQILENNATNRNVFAKLYGKSIVGTSLLKALTDLENLLNNLITPGIDNSADMVTWLNDLKLHNVQNRHSIACDLLAWTELPQVHWDEGWKEVFVHAVGMYPGITACKQFNNVSRRAKTMMERAHYSVKVRMDAAEERLKSFDFEDLWDELVSGSDRPSTSRVCFDKLRTFFNAYYAEQYGGSWPPQKQDENPFWLTRQLIQKLTEDFSSLYQYLVDREVVWAAAPQQSSHPWYFVSSRDGFVADHPEIPMTALLLEVDSRYNWPHMPYAYPKIPPSYSPSSEPKLKKVFGKTPKASQKTVFNTRNHEIAASLSYGYASNVMHLPESVSNDLLDRFCDHEKSLPPAEINPDFARRGHWILIYAILQILADVNVDSRGVRFKDNTSYPLCTRLKEDGNCFEPYPGAFDDDPIQDNRHEDSFCWRVPLTWSGGKDQSHGSDRGSGLQDSWDSRGRRTMDSGSTGSSLVARLQNLPFRNRPETQDYPYRSDDNQHGHPTPDAGSSGVQGIQGGLRRGIKPSSLSSVNNGSGPSASSMSSYNASSNTAYDTRLINMGPGDDARITFPEALVEEQSELVEETQLLEEEHLLEDDESDQHNESQHQEGAHNDEDAWEDTENGNTSFSDLM